MKVSIVTKKAGFKISNTRKPVRFFMSERGIDVKIDDPEKGKIGQVLFPVKFDGAWIGVRTPLPSLGQHTQEILSSWGFPGRSLRS